MLKNHPNHHLKFCFCLFEETDDSWDLKMFSVSYQPALLSASPIPIPPLPHPRPPAPHHFTPSSHPALGMTATLKGNGCNTTPSRPCKLGRGAPRGTLKLIRWSREDKKRKSSSLASDSPTQTRGPAPNGKKQGGVTRRPWWSRKRSETAGKHRRSWCVRVLFLKQSL